MENTDKQDFLDKCRDADFVQEIISQFHKLYYYASAKGLGWKNNYWLGVSIQKNPMDLQVYQELIFEVKPDIIIETGTKVGGSALFFASILDMLKNGEVISIDINGKGKLPEHDRITYLWANSVDEATINFLIPKTKNKKVLVILDSDHHKDHVLKELEIYSKLVSVGSYIIVEDTNCSGHPVIGIEGEGPLEAIQIFLDTNKDFVVDRYWEKNFFSFNPCGFLKKVK